MKAKSDSSKCPVCGKGILHPVVSEFKTHFDDENGIQRELVVPSVPFQRCDTCGEEILDQNASDKIANAQRSAMGLLSADEILALRHTLGRTQRQMSELLGIGEKTYCRWESGTHFQSEAFDRYLRLLGSNPDAVKNLERIAHEKTVTDPVDLHNLGFSYLEDLRVYESASARFLELLRTGPFCTA